MVGPEREIPFEKGQQNHERVRYIRDASFTFTLLTSLVLSAALVAAAFIVRGRHSPLVFYGHDRPPGPGSAP